MARGVGTIITQALEAWYIRHTQGCPCASIAAEMDQVGPDKVEQQLDSYAERMQESARVWRRETGVPLPTPPLAILKSLINYGIKKHREELAA